MTILPTCVFLAVASGTVLLLHPSIPELGRNMLGPLQPALCRMYESAAHVVVFLTMTGVLLLWSGASRLRRRSVLGSVVAFAVASEFAQSWSPGRNADPGDGVCNLAGVLGAVLIDRLIASKKRSPRFQRSGIPSDAEYGV